MVEMTETVQTQYTKPKRILLKLSGEALGGASGK